MIALILDGVPFEQDVRELFMAFYPGERYTHVPDENAMISFHAEPVGEPAFSCTGDTAADDTGRPAGASLPGEKGALEISPDAPEGTRCGILKLTLSLRSAGQEEGAGAEENAAAPAEGRTRTSCSTVYTDRLHTKNALKRAVYRMLCAENARTLPWGTLTGIRPTKLALTELRNGVPEETVKRHFRERYFMSVEKTELCVRTAAHELKAIRGLDLKDGWSLYVGIPFCPTTCLYCSFTSYAVGRAGKKVDAYLDALLEELRAVAEIMKDRPPETVYMGGGTPTSLSAAQLDRVLTALEECFDMSRVKELTVEAGRPDSITEDKLRTLKAHGVTRISINPQTLKQETLDLIGRRHTVEEFIEKFRLARSLGFDNINTDLIVGLPNETADDVRRTMEGIRDLAPDDVTIHSLALKRAARLNTKKEDYAEVTYGNASEMVSLAAECCTAMGLSPYYLYRQKNMAGNLENVGWCRPGREGLYNILIMEELQTIVGCGAGTTTRVVFPDEDRYERAENVKDPELYAARLEEMVGRKKSLLFSRYFKVQ